MARRKRGRAAQRIGALGALVGLLVGCSGGGGKHETKGLPDPAPGTVAAFDLDGLDSRFELQRDVSDIPALSHVTSGQEGNAYVMDSGSGQPIDILRLTSTGTVSRFASIESTAIPLGLAALPDGVLAVGRKGGLLRVDGHSTPTVLPTGHRFTYPVPIGVRPDGSLVVLDADQVWSVKDGRTTLLAGEPSDGGSDGAVDGSGTTYALLDGKTTIADLLVIPPGQPPHALRVIGHLPGGSAPVSGLNVYALAAAGDDGFYATAGTHDGTADYLIHVHGAAADVLAAFGAPDKAATCAAGHRYPALGNPCVMPYFALPLGDRVLLVGQTDDAATPALALRAPAAGVTNRQVRGTAPGNS
ncbi:hypothetical protein [Streptomyces sp. CA-111067]|uniref:hypothetical protein n=1 Tax=Streptomyces sp. CA-111067 TaxID=3240046 RepID=UPI003D9655A2